MFAWVVFVAHCLYGANVIALPHRTYGLRCEYVFWENYETQYAGKYMLMANSRSMSAFNSYWNGLAVVRIEVRSIMIYDAIHSKLFAFLIFGDIWFSVVRRGQ